MPNISRTLRQRAGVMERCEWAWRANEQASERMSPITPQFYKEVTQSFWRSYTATVQYSRCMLIKSHVHSHTLHDPIIAASLYLRSDWGHSLARLLICPPGPLTPFHYPSPLPQSSWDVRHSCAKYMVINLPLWEERQIVFTACL